MEDTMNQGSNPESNMGDNQKSTGSIVGIIIVVIILVLGGFYFWGQKLDKNGDDTINTEETATTTEETADIEADLGTVDTNLDADLEGVAGELTQ
ncbi:hypothetical protein A2996_01595 [Candidatus Campbellbacteria bacterium RIFCSPLOWO2_01_FULL_34_15]|uniref:Uncharacterized protein n=2 Tax=Candidatus Campbelliibacteriota TaxID=1752727 RepID=A0A1F5EM59_9BACT|nr:MAG: hypothetical protein A2996_01595 [Candidatus Campbellbacteria bacterium RIFCSPLOWO2_01_FULL_34_15]OGD69387.1 MAG: hypothetical protein A2811_00835 [Candidatus Campbellbacteria bacterium RIFCSPHIGHO2_01_FULL_34_10]